MNKDQLVSRFQPFIFGREAGIGRWLSGDMHPIVENRLLKLPGEPISKVQFNQLLVVSKAASVSDSFFHYYWCSIPSHPYDVRKVDGFDPSWAEDRNEIRTLEQLAWGLQRLYVDGLLFFGNVKAAFNTLRSKDLNELTRFFGEKRFDTNAISGRGPSLPLKMINRDDRYLISEMACKTFGELPEMRKAALEALNSAWDRHAGSGGGDIAFREFLKKYLTNSSNEEQLMLSYDDIVDSRVDSKEAIKNKFDTVASKFLVARENAMLNTELYLSMVNDLDVYVATSMRSRKNFRDMADACARIFGDQSLKSLHLRYFDPTLSAAKGHEDKGLIECLMVKCAKVLVYCEGEKESYGKDAEAAMALSLGKPVIFYCDHGKKTNFYRDVHPLARLIDFRSGVAVGAVVSDDVAQVTELLRRIFGNDMEYKIEHHPTRPGFLKLVEKLTNSVLRLQTDDDLIKKTFWNNYHNRSKQDVPSLAAGKEAERLRE